MSLQLRLDPIACDGHGLCADLLPELIELDEWGYPILLAAEVPHGLAGHARRAVHGCPTLALILSRQRLTGQHPGRGHQTQQNLARPARPAPGQMPAEDRRPSRPPAT
ncbi:MAG: ferredoxin [Streptosporangiaceae bacterium]